MTPRLARRMIGPAFFLAMVVSIIPFVTPLAIAQLPAFYYGTVTVIGPERSIPALAGSTISARSNSADVTPITVTVGLGGRYGGPTGPEDKLLVQDTPARSLSRGDVILFFNNGVQANESSTFESGSVKRQDLTVNDNEGPTSPDKLLQTTAKNINLPTFSWEPSADRLSGVASYAIRIGDGEWQTLGSLLEWTAITRVADGRHVFEVKAKDGVGNFGALSSLIFEIDARLPAIINPTVSSLGENSAIVSWTTNKPTLSWLDYGLSAGNYVEAWSKTTSEVLAINHAATFTGLSARTTYHYRIRIKDSQGQQAATGDLFFTTLAPPGPGSINLGGGPTTTTPAAATTLVPSTTVSSPGTTEPPVASTTTAQPVRKLIDEKGFIISNVSLSSEDKGVTVNISAGSKALEPSGKPLAQLLVVPLRNPPLFPTGVVLAAYDFQPQGATFSPPAPMTFNFIRAAIPRGYTEESLKIANFDTATGSWVSLPTVVDVAGGTASTLITRFAPYALVVEDISTTVAPVPTGGSSVIDRVIGKIIWAAAALLAFIAALVAMVVIFRIRSKKT